MNAFAPAVEDQTEDQLRTTASSLRQRIRTLQDELDKTNEKLSEYDDRDPIDTFSLEDREALDRLIIQARETLCSHTNITVDGYPFPIKTQIIWDYGDITFDDTSIDWGNFEPTTDVERYIKEDISDWFDDDGDASIDALDESEWWRARREQWEQMLERGQRFDALYDGFEFDDYLSDEVG